MMRLPFQLLTALLTGASLTLAFAPFHYAVFAFIAPAFLLGLLLAGTPRQAALKSWLFGVGLFSGSVSWVYISIHTYGGSNAVLALFLTLLFISVLALFTMVGGYLFRRLAISNKPWQILILFPLCWVFSEWLRSFIGSGFPWVFLGYSQLDTPLRGFAPLIGVYGLSALTAFSASLVYLIALQSSLWRSRFLYLLTLGLLLGAGAGLNQINWTHPLPKQLTVSLIQGNIAQEMKWDPKHFDDILTTYLQLYRSQLGRDLIIWPEGAIPAPTYYIGDYLGVVDEEARQHHSAMLVGTILADSDNNLYNGMVALGDAQGEYAKRHLVPFGEYLPLQRWLRGIINFFNIPMSNLVPGPKKQALLEVKGLKLSPSICYEVAYPSLIWAQAAKANLLVNISDDSWFGHSIAAQQQLQIAQLRALETGRPMLVVNNDGITAVISAKGEILQQLAPNERQILTTTVQGYAGITPLLRSHIF